jgi:hypothetical protein
MRALLVLLLVALPLTGCLGPEPGLVERGDTVVTTISVVHAATGLVLMSYPENITVGGPRGVIAPEDVENLLGARAGDTVLVPKQGSGNYEFAPRAHLARAPYLAELPYAINYSGEDFRKDLQRVPVLGDRIEGVRFAGIPIDIRVTEIGHMFGNERIEKTADGGIVRSRVGTMSRDTWTNGAVQHTEAPFNVEQEFPPEPAFANLTPFNRKLDTTWVLFRADIEDGQRLPMGAAGGWVVARVDAERNLVNLSVQPQVGLAFPVALGINPLGLPADGSYRVEAVNGSRMELTFHPSPFAALRGQDVVFHIAVEDVIKEAAAFGQDGQYGVRESPVYRGSRTIDPVPPKAESGHA